MPARSAPARPVPVDPAPARRPVRSPARRRRPGALPVAAVLLGAVLAAGPAARPARAQSGFERGARVGPAAAPAGSVRYALRNARVETVPGSGPVPPQTVFAVDWTRTEAGAGGAAELVILVEDWTGRNERAWSVLLPNDDAETSGTVRASVFGLTNPPAAGAGGPADGPGVEAFAVIPGPPALGGSVAVSDVVRTGRVRTPTTVRAFSPTELATIRRYSPPGAPPEGHVLVDEQTPLRPGMPVRFGEDGAWVEAELLALGDGRATLRRLDGPARDRFGREVPPKIASARIAGGWVAVAAETLAAAEADPDRFRPSVRVQPGGSLVLPDDAVPLPDDYRQSVPPGTPLFAEHDGQWVPVLLRASYDDGRVLLRDGAGPDANEEVKRAPEVAVRSSTLARLGNPATVARFEQNAAEWGPPPRTVDDGPRLTDRQLAERPAIDLEDGRFPRPEGAPLGKLQNRPIRARIPPAGMKVPDNLDLPVGTPVYYNWGRSWKKTVVIGAGASNPVCTNESGETGRLKQLNHYYVREHLVIEKEVVRALRAAAKTD